MVGKIKEDVKRDVLRYLNNRIHKRWKVEDFTLSSICEAVNETSDRTENILEKLKEGGSIDSHRVETDIFLPKDTDGGKVVKELEKKGLITMSPYVAFFFAMIIFFFVYRYVFKVPTEVANLGVVAAYFKGMENGIIFATIFGLGIAAVIQGGMKRFKKWKISSEETYYRVAQICKYTTYLSAPSLAVYYLCVIILASQMMPEAVMLILLTCIGIAIGYVALTKSE